MARRRVRETLEMEFNLGGNAPAKFNEMSKSMVAFRQQTRFTTDETKALKKALRDIEGVTKLTISTNRISTQAWEDNEEAIRRVERQNKRLNASLNKVQKELRTARRGLERKNKEEQEAAKRTRQLARQQYFLASGFTTSSKGLGRYLGLLARGGALLGGFGVALGGVFVGMRAIEKTIGTGVKGFVALNKEILTATRTFAEFEQQATEAAALVGGDIERITIRFANAAKEAGSSTLFTATESAQALRFLALAGFDAQQSIDSLLPVIQLATAGNLELGKSADIVTNIMTSYELQASELTKTNDTLVSTFTNSNSNLIQIGNSFQYVGGIAKAANQDLENIAAAIGVLANQGIRGSKAGRTLSNAIQRLLNPTSRGQQILERYGVSVRDASGNVRQLTEIFRDLRAEGIAASDILELFGTVAGRNLVALIQRGVPAIDALRQKIDEGSGSAQRLADTFEQTLQGRVRLLQSALESLRISAVEGLSDSFSRLIEDITALVRGMEESGDATRLANSIVATSAQLLRTLIQLLPVFISLTEKSTKALSKLNLALLYTRESYLALKVGLLSLRQIPMFGPQEVEGLEEANQALRRISQERKTAQEEDEKAQKALTESFDQLNKMVKEGIALADPMLDNLSKDTQARSQNMLAIRGQRQELEALQESSRKSLEELMKANEQIFAFGSQQERFDAALEELLLKRQSQGNFTSPTQAEINAYRDSRLFSAATEFVEADPTPRPPKGGGRSRDRTNQRDAQRAARELARDAKRRSESITKVLRARQDARANLNKLLLEEEQLRVAAGLRATENANTDIQFERQRQAISESFQVRRQALEEQYRAVRQGILTQEQQGVDQNLIQLQLKAAQAKEQREILDLNQLENSELEKSLETQNQLYEAEKRRRDLEIERFNQRERQRVQGAFNTVASGFGADTGLVSTAFNRQRVAELAVLQDRINATQDLEREYHQARLEQAEREFQIEQRNIQLLEQKFSLLEGGIQQFGALTSSVMLYQEEMAKLPEGAEQSAEAQRAFAAATQAAMNVGSQFGALFIESGKKLAAFQGALAQAFAGFYFAKWAGSFFTDGSAALAFAKYQASAAKFFLISRSSGGGAGAGVGASGSAETSATSATQAQGLQDTRKQYLELADSIADALERNNLRSTNVYVTLDGRGMIIPSTGPEAQRFLSDAMSEGTRQGVKLLESNRG